MTTAAPSAASRRAMPAPMPREAPVTRATLPDSGSVAVEREETEEEGEAVMVFPWWKGLDMAQWSARDSFLGSQ
ncbi:hypothetical protein D3C71_1627830 [compost metagenome]